MTSVELFAGVGGLALGLSNAGFNHRAIVEIDADACETIRENQTRKVEPMDQWPLHQTDVRAFDFGAIGEGVDLLAAGVPCQPWSLGGKHRGYEDERNLFPDAVAAIRLLKPKAVIIENVKGLRVKEVMDVAGIHGLYATPKGVRHGFGIKATVSEIPLNMTQKWMGYSRLETTATYANAVGPEEQKIAERMWHECPEHTWQNFSQGREVN